MKMTNNSSGQLPMQTFFINPSSSMMNTVSSNQTHGAYVQSYPVNSVMTTEALQTLFLQQQQQQLHQQQQQQQHQQQQQQQFLNQFQYDPHRIMLPTQFMQQQFSQSMPSFSKNNPPSSISNGLTHMNDWQNLQPNNSYPLNTFIAQKAFPSSVSSFFQNDFVKSLQGPGSCSSSDPVNNKSGGREFLNANTRLSQTHNAPMQSVTSDGVLLPLVSTLQNPKLSQHDEDPKQQLKQCVSKIEEALQDPSLATAGKVLLHAIQSSSDYMNSMLENKREQNAMSQHHAEETKSYTHNPSHEQSYDNTNTLFPELPSWKSTCVQSKAETSQEETSALVVTPILSSSTPPPPPLKLPKAKATTRSPMSKSTRATKAVVVHKATCGKMEKKKNNNKSSTLEVTLSPHETLLMILRERKVSLDRIPTHESGYFAEPTPLQLASFGTRILQAVNESDTETLSALLDCGISPNPCNSFGDALLSLICKRADNDVFQVFVDHGCDLQVCDSFGRTVLHHLAWAPKFSADMAQTILRRDWTQALMEDKHGRCPLEYVRSSQWTEWKEFLMEYKDELWPMGIPSTVPPRVYPRANVSDPPFAVSPNLAMQISSGTVQPDEVRQLRTSSSL
jgi:type II secretory pathway pseudopilin PulG